MLRKFTAMFVVLVFAGLLLAGCGKKWLTGGRDEKQEEGGEETSESISLQMEDSTAIELESYSDQPGGTAPAGSGHTVKP